MRKSIAILIMAIAAAVAPAASIVTEKFIDEQIQRESGGNPRAIGKAGEVGLGQISLIALEDLNAAYGRNWKPEDRFCPVENRKMTRSFFVLIEKRFRAVTGRQPTEKQLERVYIRGLEGALNRQNTRVSAQQKAKQA